MGNFETFISTNPAKPKLTRAFNDIVQNCAWEFCCKNIQRLVSIIFLCYPDHNLFTTQREQTGTTRVNLLPRILATEVYQMCVALFMIATIFHKKIRRQNKNTIKTQFFPLRLGTKTTILFLCLYCCVFFLFPFCAQCCT